MKLMLYKFAVNKLKSLEQMKTLTEPSIKSLCTKLEKYVKIENPAFYDRIILAMSEHYDAAITDGKTQCKMQIVLEETDSQASKAIIKLDANETIYDIAEVDSMSNSFEEMKKTFQEIPQ